MGKRFRLLGGVWLLGVFRFSFGFVYWYRMSMKYVEFVIISMNLLVCLIMVLLLVCCCCMCYYCW